MNSLASTSPGIASTEGVFREGAGDVVGTGVEQANRNVPIIIV